MKHVLLGIAASLLWLTCQKRNGSDMWATYTAAGLIFQVYVAMYILLQPTRSWGDAEKEAQNEAKKGTGRRLLFLFSRVFALARDVDGDGGAENAEEAEHDHEGTHIVLEHFADEKGRGDGRGDGKRV